MKMTELMKMLDDLDAPQRAAMEEVTSDIAKLVFGIRTLETQNDDALDFHHVAIWQLCVALAAAYRAGLSAGAAAAKKP